MNKKLRSQGENIVDYTKELENMVEYTKELIRLSEDTFNEKIKKDIVSFWIGYINFELYFRETSGFFTYESSKLSYGIYSTKFDISELTSEELEEIINYYSKKGYNLNYYDNVVTEKPDIIIIDWSHPNKQKLKDKIYIFKFRYLKFKKIFRINNQECNLFKTLFFTLKDFYWYYFWNHKYCISAYSLYKKTIKAKKYITRRNLKAQ